MSTSVKVRLQKSSRFAFPFFWFLIANHKQSTIDVKAQAYSSDCAFIKNVHIVAVVIVMPDGAVRQLPCLPISSGGLARGDLALKISPDICAAVDCKPLFFCPPSQTWRQGAAQASMLTGLIAHLHHTITPPLLQRVKKNLKPALPTPPVAHGNQV
jgi:hypothetical protein